VGVSGDIANTGNANCCDGFYMRLNLVGDPNLSNPKPEQWFNQDAFAAPAPFTFGTLGRNTFRTDGVTNLDLSLFRQFRLAGESKRLEFRAEAFNIFNHPDYDRPSNDLSSPNFGRVFGLAPGTSPRQLQLGLKFLF
jgi:hypothetical protein